MLAAFASAFYSRTELHAVLADAVKLYDLVVYDFMEIVPEEMRAPGICLRHILGVMREAECTIITGHGRCDSYTRAPGLAQGDPAVRWR